MTISIGQSLKQAREDRHLTLEKVSEVTRIRLHYLQALEADDYTSMPSPVQGRGFLRLYAGYLGLDVDALVAEMRRAQSEESEIDKFAPEFRVHSYHDTGERSPAAGSAAEEAAEGEPFWKTWLRRRKTETGLATTDLPPEEADHAEPEPPPPVEPTTETETIPTPESASPEPTEPAQPDEPTAEATSPAEPAPTPEPESLPEPLQQAPEIESATEPASEQPTPVWRSWLDRLRKFRKEAQTEVPNVEEASTEPSPEAIETSSEAPEPTETVETPAPVRSSNEVFTEIGNTLRQRRELLSLTIEEVEQHTRVRAHYLKALEAGEFEHIPSPVQTRGMLSNYASFLDMDVDSVLLDFAEGLQRWHAERHPELSEASRQADNGSRSFLPRIRTFIATDLIFGIGMVVLLLAFAIWGAGRIIRLQQTEGTPEATGPSISDVLLITPTAEVIQTATFATNQPNSPINDATLTALAPSQEAPANVSLYVVARERTYMRVTVDGKVVFDGRVIPGNSYPYEADNYIEILTGNAAALQVVYNQRDLGLMGNFGEIVDQVYTAQGIQTPTSTPPPTSTPTPRFSPTPTRTPTGTPTSTSTRLPTATSLAP